MGIDLLDVSFRLENTTGVRLSQSDWQSLAMNGDVTVGDLYSLLLCRLKYDANVKTDIQLNETVWQQTRLAIAQVANVPMPDVTMQRSLEELLPESSRPEMWKRLQETLKLSVPLLELPPSLRRRRVLEVNVILLAIPLVPAGVLWSILLRDQHPDSLWFLPIVFVLSTLISAALYSVRHHSYWERRRRVLPRGVETVKELCRRIRDLNAFRLIGRPLSQDLDECQKIWTSLKDCLINALGVDEDEVTMEARLIKDLGAE